MNRFKSYLSAAALSSMLTCTAVFTAVTPAAASAIQETEITSADSLHGDEAVQESSEIPVRDSKMGRSPSAMNIDLEDGEYSIQVECIGGSGKASVSSPTLLLVEDGKAYARLQWSSENYDYMIVDGEKYLNEKADGGNSEFTVPILSIDTPLKYIADTTAMGTPHEIEYTFTFYAESIGSKGDLPQEAAKKVVAIALVIIVGGGILNYFVKKRYRQ